MRSELRGVTMKQVPITVGMATYDDYDGVFFSIEALRMYHGDVHELSIVVVDNNPESPYGKEVKELIARINDPNVYYYQFTDHNSTFVKREVFRVAPADYVVCMDCHVMLVPGSLRMLAEYYAAYPNTNSIHQGPLISDDLKTISTHLTPKWSGGFFGQWATKPEAEYHPATPFEIEANGMGLFSCRKDAMPLLNENMRGFGGEEFYIQDKFRMQGGKCLCHPYLKWLHRFGRPGGVPYPLNRLDILRNYLLGWHETGRDLMSIIEHYNEFIGEREVRKLLEQMIKEGLP